jgi:hypothetical protein
VASDILLDEQSHLAVAFQFPALEDSNVFQQAELVVALAV